MGMVMEETCRYKEGVVMEMVVEEYVSVMEWKRTIRTMLKAKGSFYYANEHDLLIKGLISHSMHRSVKLQKRWILSLI